MPQVSQENHFTRYYKANAMKYKAFHIRMAQEVENNENIEKAFVEQLRRDH